MRGAALEAGSPLVKGAEAWDDARPTQRESPPERAPRLARRGDRRDHPRARLGVRAADLAGFHLLAVEGRHRGDLADRPRLAAHFGADGAKQRLRDRARRDTRRGLARARALEDVADVVVADLQRARRV